LRRRSWPVTRLTTSLSEARLTANPVLRVEVETARAWGVPHSVLKGRVVAEGQPLFTADDSSLAIALQALEARTCACGHDRVDTTAADAEFAFAAEAIRCHACAARERAASAFVDSGGSTAGLLWAVNRKSSGPEGG